jgi:prepilin-type N-terminal cleavage/methylation domain-containing protein
MVTRTRAPKGYSLIEVVIVVGLIGLLAMVAPRMFLQVTRYLRMSRAHHEIQRDSKNALVVINRALRQAKASSIVISSKPGPPAQPPYSWITFDKYISPTSSRTMQFYQQGNTLYAVDNGKTRVLCSNLRYIAFTYPRTDDPYILSISVTMERATYEGKAKALHLAVEKVRIMNI